MTQGLENALWRTVSDVERPKSYIDVIQDYTNYLTVDVSNPTDMLCPLFCISHICDIFENEENSQINKVVIPLYVIHNWREEYRTIDSALKHIFDESCSLVLCKSTVKEETFYGNKSLILDNNFKALFIPCLRYDAINKIIKDYIILVDYNMFLNKDTIVKKAIMGKLIPYYLEQKIAVTFKGGDIGRTRPSVLFRKLDNVIQNISTVYNPNPYEILESNLDNLITSIDYAS